MEPTQFPILMYHRIDDPAYMHQVGLKLSGEHCTRERFTTHMERLAREYTVLPLLEIIAAIGNEETLPANVAALTFDDGTRDHIKVVLPILRDYGLPATFFVISSTLSGLIPPTFKLQILTNGVIAEKEIEDFLQRTLKQYAPEFLKKYHEGIVVPPERYIGEPTEFVRQIKYLINYLMPASVKDRVVAVLFSKLFQDEKEICEKMFLQKEEIQQLANAGMDIGCHSRNHYNLATLLPYWNKIIREIYGSKRKIRSLTGVTTPLFCYPQGGRQGYTAEIVDLVRKHYKGAVIADSQKKLCSSAESLYEMERMHEKYVDALI